MKASSPSPIKDSSSSTSQVGSDSIDDAKVEKNFSLSDSVEFSNNNWYVSMYSDCNHRNISRQNSKISDLSSQSLAHESFLDLPARLVDFKILEDYGRSRRETILSSQLGRIGNRRLSGNCSLIKKNSIPIDIRNRKLRENINFKERSQKRSTQNKNSQNGSSLPDTLDERDLFEPLISPIKRQANEDTQFYP